MPAVNAFLLAIVVIATSGVSAQTICPGLYQEALRTCLRSTYMAPSLLSLDASKDRLYDTVDVLTREGKRGAEGLYTGYFVPLDGQPNSDPSQDIFNNNAGLNQEHLWPRSEGVDGKPAERDMHHLYPTRVIVNSDRGSLPFCDAPDASVTTWYYLAESRTTAPATNRDAWSERIANQCFEPRESKKGEVARAMFYIASLYEGTVNQAFFDRQKATLLTWHRSDPATSEDVARSSRVRALQGNDNPFVLDSSLVARAFFDAPTANEEVPSRVPLAASIYPNPTRRTATVTLAGASSLRTTIDVIDLVGRVVWTVNSTGSTIDLQLPDGLAPGVYAVRVSTEAGMLVRPLTIRR